MGRRRSDLDPEKYSHRVASAIRARREGAGITQAAFADAVGVSVSAVYNWENGHRAPVLDMLPKIAEALGCTVSELMPPR